MEHLLELLNMAGNGDFLTTEEGLYLYEHAPLPNLMMHAHAMRMKLHPDNYVGWIIDRNVNITNVCISRCKFCNFHRIPGDEDTYITATEAYFPRIRELFELGGNQLLMQGGLHPELSLDYYTCLFSALKKEFPTLRLHALGPPEIVHLAKLSKKSFQTVMEELREAGLDSLPGAGAEILSDRVRKALSPGKCNTGDWLEVMRIAHRMNLATSATMMFGHIETNEERIEHLVKLRALQAEKPAGSYGFVTFVPWPFQDENTSLKMHKGVSNSVTAEGYIRMIAISRLMMPNIPNIQASWLTVGKETAQICLHAGANDFGSIMIEEHVVSSAGANNSFNREQIQEAIREAGFIPRHRNQQYEPEEPGITSEFIN